MSAYAFYSVRIHGLLQILKAIPKHILIANLNLHSFHATHLSFSEQLPLCTQHSLPRKHPSFSHCISTVGFFPTQLRPPAGYLPSRSPAGYSCPNLTYRPALSLPNPLLFVSSDSFFGRAVLSQDQTEILSSLLSLRFSLCLFVDIYNVPIFYTPLSPYPCIFCYFYLVITFPLTLLTYFQCSFDTDPLFHIEVKEIVLKCIYNHVISLFKMLNASFTYRGDNVGLLLAWSTVHPMIWFIPASPSWCLGYFPYWSVALVI